MIDGVEFWEIYPQGIPTPDGVVVESVDRSGTAVRLRVINDQLRAVKIGFPGGAFTGTQLIGTKIDMIVADKPYRVTIEDVSPTFLPHEETFWVGDQRRVEAYDFWYVPLREDGTPDHVAPKPLCTPKVEGPFGSTIGAIVFTGDVYDPVTKNIGFNPSTYVFNIACKDSALYKMHLVGHTSAATASLTGSVPPVPATSMIKRESMLNAWTANFCGDGTSFTKAGQKILVTESQGMLPDGSPFLDDGDTSVEAIWGPDGALCLNTPRLDNKADIEHLCAKLGKVLPPCTGFPLPAVYVRTALP